MKARVYEVGHNELEDRAIRRMFTNVPNDAVVLICPVPTKLESGADICCICKGPLYPKTTVDASMVFYLCEPCLDSAMTRLRVSAKSRKAAFDV